MDRKTSPQGKLPESNPSVPAGKKLTVFFDGDCPLCLKEVVMIRGKDRDSQIHFTDIAATNFSASDYGYTQKELMDEMRAELADGTKISGVEVFRQMYQLIGFGPLVSLSRLWGVRQGLDVGYSVWAKNRLRITGRCDDGACAV